jgi:hypothetical protein
MGTIRRLLVANLSHRFVESTDWEHSEFCTYDLGQAVAHMTIQSQSPTSRRHLRHRHRLRRPPRGKSHRSEHPTTLTDLANQRGLSDAPRELCRVNG